MRKKHSTPMPGPPDVFHHPYPYAALRGIATRPAIPAAV
jgi:hypothetical protein